MPLYLSQETLRKYVGNHPPHPILAQTQLNHPVAVSGEHMRHPTLLHGVEEEERTDAMGNQSNKNQNAQHMICEHSTNQYVSTHPPHPIPTQTQLNHRVAVSGAHMQHHTLLHRVEEEERREGNHALKHFNRKHHHQRLNRASNFTTLTPISQHIANSQSMQKSTPITKNRIIYSDSTRYNIMAIIKSVPFENMDLNHFQQYQLLASNLLAHTQFQKPNQSNGARLTGQMFNLGWRTGYEPNSMIGTTGIVAKIHKAPSQYVSISHELPQISQFLGE